MKPQSKAKGNYKFQRMVFNPANQKLIDFLDELQELAEDAFGVATQLIIEHFIYAKMPPQLEKSINQTYLDNGSYEKIVTHLERESELNSVEAPDELQMNTMTQKQQTEGNDGKAGNNYSETNNSNPNKNKNDTKIEIVCLHCGTCGNTKYPTEKCHYGANAANRPLPWKSKPAKQNRPLDEQNTIIKKM